MIDYAKELNEQQTAAVKADPGPVLVIAGAGSGKTRTLTFRVAYLMENGLPANRILLLTFTNKAAKEMLGRVATLLPRDSTGIWGGTFHSVANRILRRHASELGYESNYLILDREDSKHLMTASIQEAGLDPRDKRFPKADLLLEIFSLSANTERPVAQIVEAQFPYIQEMTEPMLAVHKLYVAHKRKVNAMDYDDLLGNLLRLLREHPQAAEVYGRQFLAILVDEYQDTNRIQSDIVDRLAARHKNITAVGDDAQSIYSWRGANFRNIMEFPKRYPDAKVFKIEHNYRSTPQILNLANEAISANIHQFEKELRSTRKDGLIPQLIPAFSTSEQANFVASQMTALRDRGVALNNMAVLYRSHFHSMELQMELTRRNIPFSITSGLRFFEQAHIKDVAAYLKFAVSPADELSFKRIALMMPKVGNATAARLWDKLQTHDARRLSAEADTTHDAPEGSLPLSPTSTTDDAAIPDLLAILAAVPKPAQKEWRQFAETLRQMRESRVADDPAGLIEIVLQAGYEDQLKSRFENFLSRKEDLTQLAAYATRFDRTSDFLAELALMTNVESEDDALAASGDTDVVRLSTVHQAKGQEFDVVFVIWLADGAFPNTRALESGEGEEEERRLFYVAVTRARNELYLVYPQMSTGGYGAAFQKPSRFLKEIPEEFYERVEPAVPAWKRPVAFRDDGFQDDDPS